MVKANSIDISHSSGVYGYVSVGTKNDRDRLFFCWSIAIIDLGPRSGLVVSMDLFVVQEEESSARYGTGVGLANIIIALARDQRRELIGNVCFDELLVASQAANFDLNFGGNLLAAHIYCALLGILRFYRRC